MNNKVFQPKICKISVFESVVENFHLSTTMADTYTNAHMVSMVSLFLRDHRTKLSMLYKWRDFLRDNINYNQYGELRALDYSGNHSNLRFL